VANLGESAQNCGRSALRPDHDLRTSAPQMITRPRCPSEALPPWTAARSRAVAVALVLEFSIALSLYMLIVNMHVAWSERLTL